MTTPWDGRALWGFVVFCARAGRLPRRGSFARAFRRLACLVVVQCHARLGSQRSATCSAGSSRR